MSHASIPLNRWAVGLVSIGCLVAAMAMIPWAADSSSLSMCQGGLVRGGLLAGALWLALPGRNQDAAWANLSPKTAGGLLLAIILTVRIPLRILIPAAVVLGLVFIILRPRTKKRPTHSAAR